MEFLKDSFDKGLVQQITFSGFTRYPKAKSAKFFKYLKEKYGFEVNHVIRGDGKINEHYEIEEQYTGLRGAIPRGLVKTFSSASYNIIRDDCFLNYSCKAKEEKIASVYCNIITSRNEEFIDDIAKMFNSLFLKKRPDNEGIFLLQQTQSGMDWSQIPKSASKFIPENYTELICKQRQSVINNLKSKDPDGRIILLEGNPGSGKTFFIRSLLKTLTSPTYVYLPPDMVANCAQPSFIPVLKDFSREGKGPIVFIVEDGDSCIVRRSGDNMSAVSSLLNITDGIIGSSFDIRVLITTNATIEDIDEAILRPGRLCERLEFKGLEKEHAASILNRICNAKSPTQEIIDNMLNSPNGLTLASVDKHAKNWLDGTKIINEDNSTKQKKIGF